MPTTYKRLAAAATATANVATVQTLYTTTVSTVVVSTISICNQSSTAQTYRLCVSATAAFDAAGYLAFNSTVPANDTIFITSGITLSNGQYLLCSSSATTVSFSAFGAEIS